MVSYPRLNNLRKKEAAKVVAMATNEEKNNTSLASNPLTVKKIKRQHGRRTFVRVITLVVALLIVGGTVFGARMLTVGSVFSGSDSDGFFGQLRALFGEGQPLIGEKQDQVNFLLLGIGGAEHEGPNLSDTVVVASIRPSTKDIAMVSLPRDFLVEVPGYGHMKLNSAFAMGEESGYRGGGAKLARETIEPIVGLNIPYYVIADFEGFRKIVDELGGIDIDVNRAFYDYWHGIDYDEGLQHFGGEEALYFVRARYAEGPEGSDFARAGRTQQALMSIRDKALQLNLVADFGKATGILRSVGDHVRTNLSPAEMRRVYDLTHDLALDQIQSEVVDDADTGLLYSAQQNIGGYNVFVLMPSDPSYGEIQEFVAHMFDPEPPEPEDATLEVLNGTETVGIASYFADSLEIDFEVISVDNAKRSDYERTFIVDNTDGEVSIALEALQEELEESGLYSVRIKSSEQYRNTSTSDLILVLGEDYAETIY